VELLDCPKLQTWAFSSKTPHLLTIKRKLSPTHPALCTLTEHPP